MRWYFWYFWFQKGTFCKTAKETLLFCMFLVCGQKRRLRCFSATGDFLKKITITAKRKENAASDEELQAETRSSGNSRKLSNRGIQWRKATSAKAVEINLQRPPSCNHQVMQHQRRKHVLSHHHSSMDTQPVPFYRNFDKTFAQVLHKSVMEPWILRCIPSVHHPLPTQHEPRWGWGGWGVPDMRLLAPPTMFPELPGGTRRKS